MFPPFPERTCERCQGALEVLRTLLVTRLVDGRRAPGALMGLRCTGCGARFSQYRGELAEPVTEAEWVELFRSA